MSLDPISLVIEMHRARMAQMQADDDVQRIQRELHRLVTLAEGMDHLAHHLDVVYQLLRPAVSIGGPWARAAEICAMLGECRDAISLQTALWHLPEMMGQRLASDMPDEIVGEIGVAVPSPPSPPVA